MLHMVPENIRPNEKNAMHDANNPSEVSIPVCSTIAPFLVLNP